MPDVDLSRFPDVGKAASTAATPPAFEVIRARARARRHRQHLAVAVAAGVAAVAGMVVVTLPRPEGGADFAPAVQEPPGTVPWAPLAPTHARVATHRIVASPDPAVAAQTPVCQASALDTSGGLDGAGGHWVLSVTFHNTSAHPCHLDGTPTWGFTVDGTTVGVPQTNTGSADYGQPVLLDRTHDAVATAQWPTLTCGVSGTPAVPVLTMPGTSEKVSVGRVRTSPVCQGTAGTVAPLSVLSIAPVGATTPARTVSAWSGTNAKITAPSRVRAATTLRFTVILTATHNVSLATCPDFLIDLAGAHLPITRKRFALNCGAVQHRASNGVPLLPANTPVTFAMRVPVPASVRSDHAKLVWRAVVPDPVLDAAHLDVR